MHIACLCPTYGRPSLVRNSLALFLGQQLDRRHSAELVILDDAHQITDQSGGDSHLSWRVISHPFWIPLPHKYHHLVMLADRADVYACWDDDDVYLPWHIDAIAAATTASTWSHPRYVLSTYQRDPLRMAPQVEPAQGRFHGALAVGSMLLDRVGGWPDTLQATYDQQMLATLHAAAGPPADSAARRISYVYRWGDTQRHHASGSIDDRGEYRQPPIQEPGRVQVLTPEHDASTRALLSRFGCASQSPA